MRRRTRARGARSVQGARIPASDAAAAAAASAFSAAASFSPASSQSSPSSSSSSSSPSSSSTKRRTAVAAAAASALPLLLLALPSSLSAVALASGDPPPPPPQYTRYSSYHPYCSTPSAMRERSVPPLLPPGTYSSVAGAASTNLVQVVAVIRHGARTPASPRMKCWDGYWDNAETGVWDCALTTLTAPPSRNFVREVEEDPAAVDAGGGGGGEGGNPSDAAVGDDAMFLFEKRYDALSHPPDVANTFNGTCQMGQLITRGYEQQLINGRRLREAYVYDGGGGGGGNDDSGDKNLAARDERMRLFDLTAPSEGTSRPYEPPDLYYRVDDEQRTLMSGQVLLRGLFGDLIRQAEGEGGEGTSSKEDPVIVAHTADYHYDVMAPRSNICPRVEDLWDEGDLSPDYVAFNTSDEAALLRAMMVETLGNDFTDYIHDCLMTTMCTDRPLPDVLNDYVDGSSSSSPPSAPQSSEYDQKYGPDRFSRLVNFATRDYGLHLVHDDAAYSKLGIGPLWHEILSKIRPVLDPGDGAGGGVGDDVRTYPPPSPPKLALFSGHDSTLMPLLASLGGDVYDPDEWSPYASMVLVEVHKITGRTDDYDPSSPSPLKSDFAFRLIYNGEVITSKMDGCTPDLDLCDVRVLLDRVGPFATLERDCASTSAADETIGGLAEEMKRSVQEAEKILLTPGGAILFAFASILCAIAGASASYVRLRGRLRGMDGANAAAIPGDDEGGGADGAALRSSSAGTTGGIEMHPRDKGGNDMQGGLPGVALRGSPADAGLRFGRGGGGDEDEDEDGII